MRFYFTTEEEKNHIVNNNSDKEIIALHYDINFGYIDFSSETEMQVLQNKISILEAENEKLKVEQEQQNEEILVNMLANTEMFEMILGMMPAETNTKNNGGNSMIEVYCTLIIKGVKTIEDVPLVLREQVIERLKQLEVPVK